MSRFDEAPPVKPKRIGRVVVMGRMPSRRARGGRPGGPSPRSPPRVRCRTRRPGPDGAERQALDRGRHERRREVAGVDAVLGEQRVQGRSSACARTSRAMPPTSAFSAGRWFAAASSSTNSAVPRVSDASSHHARSGSGDASASAIRSTFRPARRWSTATKRSSSDREVVVHQRRLDADGGGDAAGADRRVPVLQHDLLGRVEDPPALLLGCGPRSSAPRAIVRRSLAVLERSF